MKCHKCGRECSEGGRLIGGKYVCILCELADIDAEWTNAIDELKRLYRPDDEEVAP